MKYKIFRDAKCNVNAVIQADNLENATDIVWDECLRPNKWTSDNDKVTVYDLAPFFIDSWTTDCKILKKGTCLVGANCSLNLVYVVEADSEEAALEIVKNCTVNVAEWKLLNTNEIVEATSLIFPLNITSIKMMEA